VAEPILNKIKSMVVDKLSVAYLSKSINLMEKSRVSQIMTTNQYKPPNYLT